MLDASAFVGVWAFRHLQSRTVDEVIAELREHGIEGAALTPVEAVLTPEPSEVNRRFIAEVRGRADTSFEAVMVPVIDPSQPTWRKDLQEAIDLGQDQVRGVKIFPNYHSYTLEDDFVHELARELAGRRLTLCIQTRMEDERSRHPLMTTESVAPTQIAQFATAHSELRILVCSASMIELRTYQDIPNVHVEMSYVESGRLLKDALAQLGSERLLMGTHAPLYMPAVGVVKVTADEVGDDELDRMKSGNFRRLFGEAS